MYNSSNYKEINETDLSNNFIEKDQIGENMKKLNFNTNKNDVNLKIIKFY